MSSVLRCLHVVVLFALPQSLIESFAKADVALILGTLDEILNLPGTRSLLGLLLLAILRLLGILRRLLLLLLLLGFVATTATEHSGQRMSGNMADSRADRDSAGCGRHLFEHAGLLWRGGAGRHRSRRRSGGRKTVGWRRRRRSCPGRRG